ncbi:hypothetical protein B0H13DRAFT_1591503, partial [Mycena leptocephala]
SSDTGIVRNVLNNLSLSACSRLSTRFEVDDLRRLCWIWEWDGVTLPSVASSSSQDDNPFLEGKPAPKDWTRGAMGIVLSPATHCSRVDGKRVPVYGIGINVDMDMPGGMIAVARWTAAAEGRREAFREKLDHWAMVRFGTIFMLVLPSIPPIPCADLPRLSASTKTTSLTCNLASFSRKSAICPFELPVRPSPPSPLPSKSRTATHLSAIPFPFSSGGGSRSLTKSSVAFSQTPSSRLNRPATDLTYRAPRTSVSAAAETAPNTPSSSRHEALYERLRQRCGIGLFHPLVTRILRSMLIFPHKFNFLPRHLARDD